MNAHLAVVGAFLLLVCIASLNALPVPSEGAATLEENGVAKRLWSSLQPGIPTSIKAVGFNCNRVKGTESGNFNIVNAIKVDAEGFSYNDATGNKSGRFKLGRK